LPHPVNWLKRFFKLEKPPNNLLNRYAPISKSANTQKRTENIIPKKIADIYQLLAILRENILP
jgi:hypothetical protein